VEDIFVKFIENAEKFILFCSTLFMIEVPFFVLVFCDELIIPEKDNLYLFFKIFSS